MDRLNSGCLEMQGGYKVDQLVGGERERERGGDALHFSSRSSARSNRFKPASVQPFRVSNGPSSSPFSLPFSMNTYHRP